MLSGCNANWNSDTGVVSLSILLPGTCRQSGWKTTLRIVLQKDTIDSNLTRTWCNCTDIIPPCFTAFRSAVLVSWFGPVGYEYAERNFRVPWFGQEKPQPELTACVCVCVFWRVDHVCYFVSLLAEGKLVRHDAWNQMLYQKVMKCFQQ